MSHRWVDLSHRLSERTPPFPGDPAVEITLLDSTEESSDAPRANLNCSRISTCLHCGTHMDAPYHFFGNGKTIDQVPLETCCGSALLLDLRNSLSPLADAVIGPDLLDGLTRFSGSPSRVLIYSGWQDRWGHSDYFTRHPVFSRAGARFLVDHGVTLIGVDFPSVDHQPNEAHLEFLGRGTVIVENLTNLAALPGAHLEFCAIPLALEGRDGSPVRAIARVADQSAT